MYFSLLLLLLSSSSSSTSASIPALDFTCLVYDRFKAMATLLICISEVPYSNLDQWIGYLVLILWASVSPSRHIQGNYLRNRLLQPPSVAFRFNYLLVYSNKRRYKYSINQPSLFFFIPFRTSRSGRQHSYYVFGRLSVQISALRVVIPIIFVILLIASKWILG